MDLPADPNILHSLPMVPKVVMMLQKPRSMSVSAQQPALRWLNLAVLCLPVLVTATLVPWYGLAHGYDAVEWLWFVALMSYCEMSITAGYHRLWSHSSYKAHPLLRILCEQPAIWCVPMAIGLMVVVSKLTSATVPVDIRMKMLVLHAPEALGLRQEYIRDQEGH
ncbi:MAG: hypothetical protein EBU49_14770 [Proteobacteria bacterium]|nr:hypothetical protein [Pseudomonadota bacterium]